MFYSFLADSVAGQAERFPVPRWSGEFYITRENAGFKLKLRHRRLIVKLLDFTLAGSAKFRYACRGLLSTDPETLWGHALWGWAVFAGC
jgi:hypothetical protein